MARLTTVSQARPTAHRLRPQRYTRVPRPPWCVRRAQAVGRSGVEGPGLSRVQRLLLGAGTVGLPYAWARLSRAAHQHEWMDDGDDGYGGQQQQRRPRWRRAAWRAMRAAEGVVCTAALANSWLFLWRGDFRTLLERLLGARLVWRQANMTRIISFEYLNRQVRGAVRVTVVGVGWEGPLSPSGVPLGGGGDRKSHRTLTCFYATRHVALCVRDGMWPWRRTLPVCGQLGRGRAPT